MGCATSQPLADQPPATLSKSPDASAPKQIVEVRSAGPSSEELVFTRELSNLVAEATSNARPKDTWAVLVKITDLVCSAFGLRACSLVVYSPSGAHCKLACNTGSPLQQLAAAHPDLLPAGAMAGVTRVVRSREVLCVQAGDELWASLLQQPRAAGRPDSPGPAPAPAPELALLSGGSCGCRALAVLPLPGAPSCPGALLLGHTEPLEGGVQQSWLSTLLPLLALYVCEAGLQRSLALLERVAGAGGLGALALAVTGLGEVFEWMHPEEVEARLVVLAAGGESATVYCRVPPVSADERSLLRAGTSGSLGQRSGAGPPGAPEARAGWGSLGGSGGPCGSAGSELVGTHMSLDNTLTRRCLTGRQRLLFVADVMQALKLYGEPWKDIFFESASVLNPCWVLAAPLVHEGARLGAVLWLASCRVNTDVLMRTASACASPLIHAVARATALHRPAGPPELADPGGAHPGGPPEPPRMGGLPPLPLPAAPVPPLDVPLPPAFAEALRAYESSCCGTGCGRGSSDVGGGCSTGDRVLGSLAQPASNAGAGSGVSHAAGGQAGALGPKEAAHQSLREAGMGSTAGGAGSGSGEGGGAQGGAEAQDVPVKYLLRHSPPTSALMRLYKSSIAQRAQQAPGEEEQQLAGLGHEVRILSKAGEGAFGSVYVGRWRNRLVALKIIRDSGGARSLKTAWELAVNKSLSHPAIVTVYAILTDVHLQKTSARLLRFVPAAVLEAQQGPAAAALAAATASARAASSAVGAVQDGAAAAQLTAGPYTGAELEAGPGVSTAGGDALADTSPRFPDAKSVPWGGDDSVTAASAPSAVDLGTGTALVPTEAAPGSAAPGELPASGGGDGGSGGVLPSKVIAPAALAAALNPGGGGGSNSLPTPLPSGVDSTRLGFMPGLDRLSTSNIGSRPAPAAGVASVKPQLPKVHAILMEHCNLGGLHKYIDNRMFFRDRSQPRQQAAAKGSLGPPRPASDGPTAPLPPEALHMDFILATLSEVASALQYLHAQGFVHCDLKPENVLLREATNRRGFTAKLADFGLSELRSSDGRVVGDLGGTVTHVAPESVLLRQVSSASDMYAFGVLMWELYTGQQPYRCLLAHIPQREERHRALLARVVHAGLRPAFPPGVPQDYRSLAVRCWSAEPASRPSTSEVLAELEDMYARHALAASHLP